MAISTKTEDGPRAASPVSTAARESQNQWLRSPLILSLLLFLGSVALYLPSLNSGFINYDDPAYVTNNSHVLEGLSWSNVAWAFRATVEANWHPLTWISHMADVWKFGLDPHGHHFVNIFLHAANVVLLFFVLWRATGFMGRSWVVAALFAAHPLNVECVAWIAERKSLLSMLFLLLALIAYVWYVKQRSTGRYAVVVLLFALGLMAKPMIVTLPILLLIWDYWPLRRFSSASAAKLLLEKIPFFAVSAGSSWITIYAQHSGGALGATFALPLSLRIENAIYSYVAYLGKGIWPSGLAVFYPHPEGSLAWWKVIGAALILVAITVAAWNSRRNRPYLFAGWLWYVIALVPMIGIVQVGRQAMADRYAYLPFVGLFVMAVWGISEALEPLGASSYAKSASVGIALVALSITTHLQLQHWSNSFTLFSHALAVTTHNGVAEDNFGAVLMEVGRPDLALPHFLAAATYIPELSTAHYNLGVLRQQQGNMDAAQREYELAIRCGADPNELAQAHGNLGFLILDRDPKTAEGHFAVALSIQPDKQKFLLGHGVAQCKLHNLSAAENDLSRAATFGPSAVVQLWLGHTFEEQGHVDKAIQAYDQALQIAPGLVEAQQRLTALQQRSPAHK